MARTKEKLNISLSQQVSTCERRDRSNPNTLLRFNVVMDHVKQKRDDKNDETVKLRTRAALCTVFKGSQYSGADISSRSFVFRSSRSPGSGEDTRQ